MWSDKAKRVSGHIYSHQRILLLIQYIISNHKMVLLGETVNKAFYLSLLASHITSF